MARTVGVVFGLSILFTSSNIISIFEDKEKKKKKEGGSEKREVKIHPFHLPWIRA